MHSEGDIVLVLIIIIGIIIYFLCRPSSPTEKVNYALDVKHSNDNQEDLINTVFSIAEKNGGFWYISFKSNSIEIRQKDGSTQYLCPSELGYTEIPLHKSIVYRGQRYDEFPWRVKRAAESRGYLFWLSWRSAAVYLDSYTTYDGGRSYSRDISAGDYIDAVNVCSKEYYRLYKPYKDPNKPPLKKL